MVGADGREPGLAEPARSHRITFISVVGGFLDGLYIELAHGLNTLVGARGAGKTTVLELVRFAVGSPATTPAHERAAEALVAGNLNGGRVRVGVQTKEGLRYIVTRSAGDEPVILNEDETPTEIDPRGGGLFKVDVFSQNEVESIANRADSQLGLIDDFEGDTIAEIQGRIDATLADLNANASRITPLQQKLESLTDEVQALPGVDEKLKALTEANGDDARAINQGHANKALRDREQRAIVGATELLGEVHGKLESSVGEIGSRSDALFTDEMFNGPNKALLRQIQNELSECGDRVDALLRQATNSIEANAQTLSQRAAEIDIAHKHQDLEFRTLIEQHEAARSKATERSRLERLRNDLIAKQQEAEQARAALQQLRGERNGLLQHLSELRDERFAVREKIVARLNEALAPAIRVSIVQFGNPDAYRRMLEDALKSRRLRQNVVARRLVEAFGPMELAEVIVSQNAQTLTERAGLNPEQACKTLEALTGPETRFALETVELVDLPTIELNDGGTYKKTATLSTGQKCTTILPILLMDNDSPLLIDQPEDNLDNRFVFTTIVESISKVKQRRQLVFVTHNPNIPVLADAEKVFVLASDGVSAGVANQGTVDDCKQDIVTLLEGGEDAFKRRQKRYAY
jgi:DNA repair ATPase RecN